MTIPRISLRRFPVRSFVRSYRKTRRGFHSVHRTNRELMAFIVVDGFTIQVRTGTAPIERIVAQAEQMPFYT